MWLLKYDVAAAGNEELGESADVEAVTIVYNEEDEVSAAGWEDGLGFSTGSIVNTYSYTVVLTDNKTDAMVTVK